jgi:VWFA-related protein
MLGKPLLPAFVLSFGIFVLCLAAFSQSERSTSGSVSTFKVDVKLVPVHVVVRDAHGNAIGSLNKSDFQLFDQGKPQVITQFSAESSRVGAETSTQPGIIVGPSSPPRRYTAYLFDDLHLEGNDLMLALRSADHQIAALSSTTERVAIFTTSGQKGIDFTADRAKLHQTLTQIEPRIRPSALNCPRMSYYMADLIANRGDEDMLQVATADALACGFDGNKKSIKSARQMADAAAREEVAVGRVETERSLRILKALVQGITKAPGLRAIVVVSPGFFIAQDQAQVEIIDLAVRGDVTVSALNPRGLIPPNDITDNNGGRIDPQKSAYQSISDTQEQAVLDELAEGTGGIFFHNNNDVDDGFRRTAINPEYSYVLAFSPQDVKADGRFHKLKVVVNRANVAVQARKGYYAPKK